jgi:hypothetical protein
LTIFGLFEDYSGVDGENARGIPIFWRISTLTIAHYRQMNIADKQCRKTYYQPVKVRQTESKIREKLI